MRTPACRVDVNSDRKIGAKELQRWIMEKTAEHFQEAVQESRLHFRAVDPDGDGAAPTPTVQTGGVTGWQPGGPSLVLQAGHGPGRRHSASWTRGPGGRLGASASVGVFSCSENATKHLSLQRPLLDTLTGRSAFPGRVSWDEYKVKFLASKGHNEREVAEKIKRHAELKVDEESECGLGPADQAASPRGAGDSWWPR